jgi:hypothetical protein
VSRKRLCLLQAAVVHVPGSAVLVGKAPDLNCYPFSSALLFVEACAAGGFAGVSCITVPPRALET